MCTRRRLFILTLVALPIAVIIWEFAMSLKHLQRVSREKERRNRLVLVRNLLQEYRQQFGHYPKDREFTDGRPVSWRVELLNALHSKSPNSITQYPAFDECSFPMNRTSERPACFGKDHLAVFCVISRRGPNWDEGEGRQRDTSDDNPIIVVEASLPVAGRIGWSEPVDITYGDSRVFVVSNGRHLNEIAFIRDVFVLHEKGNIECIQEPLDGTHFAILLGKREWRNE